MKCMIFREALSSAECERLRPTTPLPANRFLCPSYQNSTWFSWLLLHIIIIKFQHYYATMHTQLSFEYCIVIILLQQSFITLIYLSSEKKQSFTVFSFLLLHHLIRDQASCSHTNIKTFGQNVNTIDMENFIDYYND